MKCDELKTRETPRQDFNMKTLVAGWFSSEQMGASAGDLPTRDLVQRC